jgi:hypothetical protein
MCRSIVLSPRLLLAAQNQLFCSECNYHLGATVIPTKPHVSHYKTKDGTFYIQTKLVVKEPPCNLFTKVVRVDKVPWYWVIRCIGNDVQHNIVVLSVELNFFCLIYYSLSLAWSTCNVIQ